ncbi:MAG: Riboflavin biosynthesis protein RibD [Ignavibacteria bacterium]|nr:Riboflavin biosynthesis protein RibD [Ignavibacteria bacterium]
MTEKQAMRRALKLAQRGIGKVSPNPLVGAVLLHDEKVISEGWHKEFGGGHAEVNAIESASVADLEGSTLVVTLEPCNHTGKTPPCTELIISKGISRVVIGMPDPNPFVAGHGIESLKEAGIEVVTGILEDECRFMNRFFIEYITTGKPYIIMKIAQTIDGFIATLNGESKWITCTESRRRTHSLRASVDAVLIGKNTALKDNPELTVRLVKGINPKRIVLDKNLSLPQNLLLFTDSFKNNTILCCCEEVANSIKGKTLISNGFNIINVPVNNYGLLDLGKCIEALAKEYGIASILVEGGAQIYSSFIENNFVNELQIFISPKIIGSGLSPFADFNPGTLSFAPKFKIVKIKKSGSDLLVIALKKG